MPKEIYELLALGARYWFAFLGVVIVWRSFTWLRKDNRARHKRLKQLPDAGLVGELVVLAGSDELPPGTVIPLPREGTLGNLRSCDVCIPCGGVAPRHGDFRFVNGLGLILTPAPRMALIVDGQEPVPNQQEWLMHHGSRLVIGGAVLRLRLFMGLETARSASFQEELPRDMLPQAAMLQGEWQEGDELSPQRLDIPDPMPMETVGSPDWETEDDVQPRRQQLRAWVDTGRYDPVKGYPAWMPPPVPYQDLGADADMAQEDEEWQEDGFEEGSQENPYEDGEFPGDEWDQPLPRETFVPKRRSIFRRRR